MKLGIIFPALYLFGCSSAPHPFTNDSGTDAGTVEEKVDEAPAPVIYSHLCCMQGSLIQYCTVEPTNPWTCWDGNGSWSPDCTENICFTTEACVGVNGPGVVVDCP